MVKSAPPEPELLFFRIDSPLARREVAAIFKKNRYMSRAAGAFVGRAREVIGGQ